MDMPDAKALLFAMAALFAGCGFKHDPCAPRGFFDDGPCLDHFDKDYVEMSWTDSTGSVHALDSGNVVWDADDPYGADSVFYSRTGFFLDPAAGDDGCRLAVTFREFGWAQGKDTLRTNGVRIQGFRMGQYHWEQDAGCGRIDVPDAETWMVRTRIKLFPDAEGSRHGRDETYRLRVGWGRGHADWTLHTRIWQELYP